MATLLCGLAFVPSGARAAVSVVQATANSGVCFGGTCAAPAFSSNVAAGHMIAACFQWWIATGGTTGDSLGSVTDTLGNSFTVITGSKKVVLGTTDAAEIGVECGYANNITGGADTVTCHDALGEEYTFCEAWELSGQAASPLDQVSLGSGTSATTISTGSVAVSSGEVGITVAQGDDGLGNAALTAGSGWTMPTPWSGGNGWCADEHQAVASAGSLTGTLTTNESPHEWVVSMVTFKPPAAASPAGFRRPIGPF